MTDDRDASGKPVTVDRRSVLVEVLLKRSRVLVHPARKTGLKSSFVFPLLEYFVICLSGGGESDFTSLCLPFPLLLSLLS